MKIVRRLSELPNLDPTDLYSDVETTSFDDHTEAFYPYLGHRICGIALTCDDVKETWYLPIRHRDPETENLPLDPTLRWYQSVLDRSKRWINHNVKFDAHFASADGLEFEGLDLVCTLTLAKTIDSDRLNHQLKPLCREWCGLKMEEELEVHSYLSGLGTRKKVRDYGRVPAEVLGRYACQDVIGNRELWRYLQRRKPEGTDSLWRTEIALTKTLFHMERRGMLIDPIEARKQAMHAYMAQIRIQNAFQESTGRELVDSPKLYYEVLVGRYGLPVISRSKKTGAPSFDKYALAAYLDRQLTPEVRQVIEWILEHKRWTNYTGLFLEPFLKLTDSDHRLHPVYNQTVRTGRMSCAEPNLQQGDKRSSKLIVPGGGRAFLCADASQMEFRVIVHYIKDENAIAAIREGLDFHSWVAEVCGIDRSMAKNINFAIAFGAGEKKIELMLSSQLGPGSESMAREILRTYHDRLPGIKRTSKITEQLCKKRGWIKNAYGRRRHIAPKFAYKAFNSLVQGCAMDITKERMVFLDSSDALRRDGVCLLANKHDELVFDGPQEVIEAKDTQEFIKSALESPEFEFRVPIVWDLKTSRESWYDAKP